MLVPIATNEAPAPSDILKVVRCGCKAGCKTSRCSCFKHGLKCTHVYSECHGVSWLNCQEIRLEYNDDDYIIV